MRLYWVLLLLAIVLAVVLAPIKKTLPLTYSLSKSFSTDFACDNRTFLPAVASNPAKKPSPSPKVLVVPHHLLASTLIAKGISQINPSINTIILLSPNHANQGQCDIITSQSVWNTPFGQVNTEDKIIDKFLQTGSVCLDDDALSVEHGIATLLPFIKYYVPNTKIVPLVIKKEIDPILFNIFTQELISQAADVVTIASVDFSHGLSQSEAAKRDTFTERLILSGSYLDLLNYSSEYLDSPTSLVAILKIMEVENIQPRILAHGNSSDFNHDPSNVTSYFLISGGVITPPSTIASNAASLNPDNFSLLFAGDVMLGRSVNTRIQKFADYSWPFRQISALLSDADLTMVNLESPFRSGCRPTDTGMVFCADPKSIEGLILSGVDLVNLANNHIGNQGDMGMEDTLNTLSDSGIASIGRGQPYLKTINKIRIGFVGFNDIPPFTSGISRATKDQINNEISAIREKVDLVVTTFHWGNEYQRTHSPRQSELAHLAIDSGADLVIGHHPHWVQDSEIYQGKTIYYSLGNLVFDQMWSEETRNGLVIKLTFSGTALVNEEKIPIKIFDYGQPSVYSKSP